MTTLTEQIRRLISKSSESKYSIARGAGVARSQISRFLSGENGMTIETVERLAAYLGFMITLEPIEKQKKGR